MQTEEYENIFNLELKHWWYNSLHELILNNLSGLIKNNPSGFILDAGCGTGGVLFRVKERYPHLNLLGMDVSSHALRFSCKRGLKHLFQASTENLPFIDKSMDLVLSLDVLYHANIKDEEKALTEIHRILKHNGYLILHLPAFNILKGHHDLVTHTKRRYTKMELYHCVSSAGFRIVRCTYRNIFLFPTLYLKRSIQRKLNDSSSSSDLSTLPIWVNRVMSALGSCENKIISYLNLPLGSSLFCLARKE